MLPLSRKNIFTAEEYKLLCDTVDEQFTSKPRSENTIQELLADGWNNKLNIEHEVGKATLELRPIPQVVLDRIIAWGKEFGHDIGNEQIIAIYQRYSNEYGVPSLSPHIDFRSGGLSMDYLLRTNVNWPIRMEEEQFDLEENEAIFFDASAVVHWRPRMELADDEFVEILVIHLLVPNDELLSQEEKDQRAAKYLGEY